MNHNFISKNRLKKLKLKSFGKNIKISPNVTIIGSENIQMGDNVRIDDYTIISAKEGFLKNFILIFISVDKVILDVVVE